MSRIVSLSAGTVLPLSPEATLDIAAKASFQHVGLRLDRTNTPSGGWAALRQRADDRGITVFDV